MGQDISAPSPNRKKKKKIADQALKYNKFSYPRMTAN